MDVFGMERLFSLIGETIQLLYSVISCHHVRCSLTVQLFYLAGKGKRRRSSDEDATGEPKAKRPKHTADNKEVIGLLD